MNTETILYAHGLSHYICTQSDLLIFLQRKRKLEQFIKDSLMTPPTFVSPNQQSITKLSRRHLSHASSVSCLLNSVDSTKYHDVKIIVDSHLSSSSLTFDDALPEKEVSTEFSFLDATLDCRCKDISPTVDSDESVNGSNPLSPQNLTCKENGVSNATVDRRKSKPARRSIRLLNFIGDHLQRSVIPIGSRFQADVPEWSGPADWSILISAYTSNSDNSKWMGSRVWPTEIGNMKATRRAIGKGRPNSCRCASQGSAVCIKRHINEKRILLQCDLGPAFLAWKFDEMGEQVSKSWSVKEQKTFESLVRRSSSNGASFLNRALKCFPNKCGKDIIHYYFDVYIPYRMSTEMRSLSMRQIDTDDEVEDDEAEEDSNGLGKRSQGKKNLKICNTKDVKAKYLRGA